MARKPAAPPVVVIFGDEEYRKSVVLQQALDELLPPEADRAMALATYDGTRSDDQGGPAWAAVMDDLATLPFLAPRRVVVVRDADKFISAYRSKLETYLESPFPTGALVLECRSFPKTTRLCKAAGACGGAIHECKKLTGRALVEFAVSEARARGKPLDASAAARLVEYVGSEQGAIAGEVEKLCLYALDRPTITDHDVSELVGQSREEKIFAVMDAAASGRPAEALRLWRQVLATDPEAIYKVLGGMAFVLRRWIGAHEMRAAGESAWDIAPRVMMWGRANELEALLRRLPAPRVKRALASLAELDFQVKSGARSIETGVETLLLGLASA